MLEQAKFEYFDWSAFGVAQVVQEFMSQSPHSHLRNGESSKLVSFMQPARFASDTCFITEGDVADNGFMALILDGEVLVENIRVSRTSAITRAVLGAGAFVGELGLLDNGPRTASCTASTDVLCAVLTRDAFYSLIVKEPILGNKLMLRLSVHVSERMRDLTKKLKLYSNLCRVMQDEINRVVK
jgi:CRP-like cAMP-binding protein